MDSYSSKINRIKNTIDEIREDIEKIKKVRNNINYVKYILKQRNNNKPKYHPEFVKMKKIEDKKVNTTSESYEINNDYNYNNINPYLIENKILDNINENDDIEVNHKKSKEIIYRKNSDNNDDYNENNFDDINKKNNFMREKDKYEMIYSNINHNNNISDDDNNEEKNKISIEENSNGKNEKSDTGDLEDDDQKENIYLNNNNFGNNSPHFKKNNNKKLMTKILDLNKNEYDEPKILYEDEINRLKQEIAILENDNDFLSNQLIEEEKKNEELLAIKNEKEENDNSIIHFKYFNFL